MKSSLRITSPKKLLNSKWTAVKPTNKEKHFIVTKLILPDAALEPSSSLDKVALIMIEAIHSKRSQLVPWQQLNDTNLWLQGWV